MTGYSWFPRLPLDLTAHRWPSLQNLRKSCYPPCSHADVREAMFSCLRATSIAASDQGGLPSLRRCRYCMGIPTVDAHRRCGSSANVAAESKRRLCACNRIRCIDCRRSSHRQKSKAASPLHFAHFRRVLIVEIQRYQSVGFEVAWGMTSPVSEFPGTVKVNVAPRLHPARPPTHSKRPLLNRTRQYPSFPRSLNSLALRIVAASRTA